MQVNSISGQTFQAKLNLNGKRGDEYWKRIAESFDKKTLDLNSRNKKLGVSYQVGQDQSGISFYQAVGKKDANAWIHYVDISRSSMMKLMQKSTEEIADTLAFVARMFKKTDDQATIVYDYIKKTGENVETDVKFLTEVWDTFDKHIKPLTEKEIRENEFLKDAKIVLQEC